MPAFWPFTRGAPPGAAGVPPEPFPIMEDLLRRNVEDVLAVRDQRRRGPSLLFGGELMLPPERALPILEQRLRPHGYTPFLRREDGLTWVQALPLVGVVEPRRGGLALGLFLLTVLSTLIAGSGAFGAFNPFTEPLRLLDGAPFAFTLLLILGTHEFGHYLTARAYGAQVSLPYFIPAPPPFLFGTLGAVIRLRSPARDRNALFDIAAAGPLAGLVVALPALWIGLGWSTVGAIPASGSLVFGDSLLMRAFVYLMFGSIPAGMDVFVHPVALAGWVGLFVTALNLFPVGQLDGGRIAYALFGRRHRAVSVATFVLLLLLAALTGSLNWVVWAALLFFLIGFHHAPPLDDLTPLSPGRYATGVLCLILLVLLIPPVPIQLN
ncbi:MAG: site-2 protease family protein [Candidatus Rokubacteria bacterium]|nr:site-2 protease family protein [Candidatus Rokubacteria bacterium]